MITKYKIFESVNNDKPKIGDYVIVDPRYRSDFTNGNLVKFLSENIGRVKSDYFEDIYNNDGSSYKIEPVFEVEYDDVPTTKGVRKYFVKTPYYGKASTDRYYLNSVEMKFIQYWSESKEELELILQANKYNL